MGKYSQKPQKRKRGSGSKVLPIVLAVLLVAVAGIAVFVMMNYHIVSWKLYPKDAVTLDLREEEIAPAHVDKIREKLPELYQQLETIEQAIGTDREEDVLKEVFGQIQPISIDYGVMEKAKNVYVLPSSFGWGDVGSWLAVGRINPANDAGNVVRGDVVAVNSTRCIVEGGSKMIAMVGLEDTIIVDTEDALLVCARDSAGDIKKVLEILRAVNRTELL
jgi:mannose-1-phosphate guanylyltransferase